jgi:hypothetical protein
VLKTANETIVDDDDEAKTKTATVCLTIDRFSKQLEEAAEEKNKNKVYSVVSLNFNVQNYSNDLTSVFYYYYFLYAL